MAETLHPWQDQSPGYTKTEAQTEEEKKAEKGSLGRVEDIAFLIQ